MDKTILTAKEKKIVGQLLDLVSEIEDHITLPMFEGYVFGIAMTPELIVPSEWLPFIFGEEGPEFSSEKQAQEMLNCIMGVYNKTVNKFHNRELTFPFQPGQLNKRKIAEIGDWAYGLNESLWLREEVWDFDRFDYLTDKNKEALYTFSLILDIVGSGDLPEIIAHNRFKELLHEFSRDILSPQSLGEISTVDSAEDLLGGHLPAAVSGLIEHAYHVDDLRIKRRSQSTNHHPVQKQKIGRNAPCPCGSGKKHKKCCMRKDDPAVPSNIIEVDFSRGRRIEKGAEALYQIKIGLHGARPPIWRRVQLPGDLTLAGLHSIIQICFGWEGYHLHEFVVDNVRYVPADQFDEFQLESVAQKDEETLRLQDFITDTGQKFEYVYDFGDYWRHMISVEKILPCLSLENAPELITGRRACPPEDCGGIHGYHDMLEVLEEPESPDYKELVEWLGGGFNPALFGKPEIDSINMILRTFF